MKLRRSRHDFELPLPRSPPRSSILQARVSTSRWNLVSVDNAYAALRDAPSFVGGSAHSALAAFRMAGREAHLRRPMALYWFLVMHKDLGVKRGDIAASAAASAPPRGVEM
jgi:hypothetical protein